MKRMLSTIFFSFSFLICPLMLNAQDSIAQDIKQEEAAQKPVTISTEPEGFSWGTIAAGGLIIGTVVFKSGRFVIGSALTLTKKILQRPFIAGTIGTLAVAPLLDETLFAQEPNLNPRSLARNMINRWKQQKTNAGKNIFDWSKELSSKYEATSHNLKTSHPDVYNFIIKLQDQPIANDVKNSCVALKSHMASAKNSFKEWLNEEPKKDDSKE